MERRYRRKAGTAGRLAALLTALLISLPLAACGRPGQEAASPLSSAEAGTGDAEEILEDSISEPERLKLDGEDAVRVQVFAMDTYMTLTACGEGAEEAVLAGAEEVVRLDRLWSVGREDSEISILNREGRARVSEETAGLIRLSREVSLLSGGKLDITVYPLMVLWGFTTGDYRVPEEEELRKVLSLVDQDRITLETEGEETWAGLDQGQGMDLGAVAKGETSARIMEIFKDHGITSGLVSLGGNVQCLGTKPSGDLWRIGLQDPENTQEIFGVLEVRDRAVITSGAYQRNFTDEETGRVYHHILDPDTGYPAESGILSATIVSENGALADALSTACYCMGPEDSAACWRSSDLAYEMVLVTEDGEIWLTEGLEKAFSSDRRVKVLYRD